MQNILRISLLTCVPGGDTAGIQPALELMMDTGTRVPQSPLSANSAVPLPQERVLPSCFCCGFAARDFLWLHCFLGNQVMPIALLQVTCRQGSVGFLNDTIVLIFLPPIPFG